MDQTRRDYNKKILDRIASDPTFREELLDDPKGAMERAGLKWEGGGADDVVGFGIFGAEPLPPVPNPPPSNPITTGLCGETMTFDLQEKSKDPVHGGPLPPSPTDPAPPVNS
jgi:hypothetical protein